MPKISVQSKGPAPDASSRTEMIRRRAIIATQIAKTPSGNPLQKPLIGDYHLNKGFTNGVVQYRFTPGLNNTTRI